MPYINSKILDKGDFFSQECNLAFNTTSYDNYSSKTALALCAAAISDKFYLEREDSGRENRWKLQMIFYPCKNNFLSFVIFF